jgi:hypothetical protein
MSRPNTAGVTLSGIKVDDMRAIDGNVDRTQWPLIRACEHNFRLARRYRRNDRLRRLRRAARTTNRNE